MNSNRQGLCNWPTRAQWPTRALALGFVVVALGSLHGQEPGNRLAPEAKSAPAWKSAAALRTQLETPISLVWGDREARSALESLSRSTGVAIFLDRRIDPSQKLTLKAADEPLRAVLLSAAGQLDGGVAPIGSVVYVGPKATASKLLALAALRRQEAGKLPAQARVRFTKSEAWSWDELAEPRQLLEELAARGRIRVENPELFPHDLWPAADWPALAWTERMSLLLAGFDLTYELTGDAAIRLVPIPQELTFEKTYTPRGDSDRAAIDLSRVVPEAKIVVERGVLRVIASAADHERIDKLLRGESVTTTKVTPGTKRYTLTAQNKPAGAVMKTIAAQLGKELKCDAEVAQKLQTEVSLAVREVPLDELLAKTLSPLGLTYHLGETVLEIVPKP